MTAPDDPQPRYDPPRDEVYIAFAEAMGAWSDLETQTVLLFGQLAGITDVNIAWAIFHSAGGGRAQRDMILAVARLRLGEVTRASVEDVVQKRLGKAAGKRNRMVHGIWNKTTCVEDDGAKTWELFREFSAPTEPLGFVPDNDRAVKELREKGIRFYLDDLRAVREEYRRLRRDMMALQGELLRALGPKIVG
ncbi:hypothetical protein [Falsiroseomonas sp. HW251]|uniref:hypothetical protein n=1 Tax=Falsiroseomonas sp. HW251 TaxID=3390998 RepID=UPI003D315440